MWFASHGHFKEQDPWPMDGKVKLNLALLSFPDIILGSCRPVGCTEGWYSIHMALLATDLISCSLQWFLLTSLPHTWQLQFCYSSTMTTSTPWLQRQGRPSLHNIQSLFNEERNEKTTFYPILHTIMFPFSNKSTTKEIIEQPSHWLHSPSQSTGNLSNVADMPQALIRSRFLLFLARKNNVVQPCSYTIHSLSIHRTKAFCFVKR